MKIWIDFDNSPHVLFFAPIIRELRQRGHEVVLTGRDFAQTRELAQQYALDCAIVGNTGTNRSTIRKVSGAFQRACALAQFVRKHKVDAAISHGSRGLVLGARILGKPVLTFYDYEFASYRLFNWCSARLCAPEVIPVGRLTRMGLDVRKLVRYPGLKEEVYVYDFHPDKTILAKLGLGSGRGTVTVRPPAPWAHYHDPKSDVLFDALMARLREETEVQSVVLARTASQAAEIKERYGDRFSRLLVSHHAVDALSLMWQSIAIFSGGGTMTREAALLGLNVYSTFAGQHGAADEHLIETGRLKLLREPDEIRRLTFHPAQKEMQLPQDRKKLAARFAGEIIRFGEEYA